MIKDTTGLTLDQMEGLIEQLNNEIGALKQVVKEPELLVSQLKQAAKDDESKIDQLHDLERMAMGDHEQVEGEFFTFTMGHISPDSSRNWTLDRDKTIKLSKLKKDFEESYGSLLKTVKSIDETKIKKRLADGTLTVTPSGVIIDSDGVVLPGYSGALKRPNVNTKAKEV